MLALLMAVSIVLFPLSLGAALGLYLRARNVTEDNRRLRLMLTEFCEMEASNAPFPH